ncbi:hypothetical protein E1A91_A11G346300v1 [Gossypium mustelinum]|uniref:Uncharacterized protein n=3 Tax=Gossypium TaxID=3633 RepID=A0A5J5TZR4_GOSBA|nr:hypothetical protein ES319_A11G337700v1 [Gossypium barbadense]TYG96659.1 hypothetical protein ES288_A11G369000v1 [Gossypium darwinii]TYJ12389.1 hypothetical protein E1A91_A11G346300v1 [Gossypium mustelinum]
MAGLQYNFFPTDFYYPRPAQSTPSPAVDSTPPAALTTPIEEKNIVDDDNKKPVIVVYRGNKTSVSIRKQGEQHGRSYVRNRVEQIKLSRN